MEKSNVAIFCNTHCDKTNLTDDLIISTWKEFIILDGNDSVDSAIILNNLQAYLQH